MPPHKKKSWVHSGARFCASSLITVSCWAVWLGLSLTLACLLYVALARELPVPGFALRRIENELAASGFDLKFGRARIDPSGKVLLEDVQLRLRPFDDPLLSCRLLYIRHDFWSLLAGRPAPAEIQVEGAALYLPAMLSASGTTEPVVNGLAARLHYEQHVWEIEQLACLVGTVRVTAHGEVIPTTRTGVATQFSLSDLSARYLEGARKLMPVLHELEAFDSPSLAVRFSRTRAHLLLTADAVHNPWGQPLVTGPLVAAVTLRIDQPGSAQPARVLVTAPHVDYDNGKVVAEHVRASLAATVQPRALSGAPIELRVAAGSISAANEQLVAPLVRAELAAWPAVQVEVMTQLDDEFLAVSADAQLKEKRAQIRAEGRVSANLISRTLTVRTPRAAPYFVFGDPVWFKAEATLGPGWKFEGVSARVDAGRLDSHGVKVTAARGRIDIHGMSFLAHDAYAEIGDSYARGSYWMDFSTSDYRMLLAGRLQPVDISGWFKGEWWPAFWKRYFAFPGALPAATVDVGGRWRDSLQSNNFIVARGGPATVWGGDFEHVDATVFVRPGFAHAWNIAATRAAGSQRVTGSFKRTAALGAHDEGRFEFDFTGNPELAVVGRMLEGRADEVLAPLAVSSPPQIHAWGAFDGSQTAYQFTGDTRTPLHYFGFPFDNARVSGAVRGPDIELDDIEFEAAGGTGKVRASLRGTPAERRLGFDIFVNGAKLGRVVHAFEEFDAVHHGRVYVASPDSKFVRKASNSTLDFAFSAQGAPGAVASFNGTGNASLTGAELGEVRLFGLLSQVLSGLSLSFSSLKLDAVRTSFTVDNGTAHFPDVKVTGPSAVIDARGNYSFATNALDFNAKFKPYDQPGSLLAAAVGLVMNPLTSILELRLTGPFGDPKWSVDVTAPSSKPTRPAEPKAPPPAAVPPATK